MEASTTNGDNTIHRCVSHTEIIIMAENMGIMAINGQVGTATVKINEVTITERTVISTTRVRAVIISDIAMATGGIDT
jgi:hypothetical protein